MSATDTKKINIHVGFILVMRLDRELLSVEAERKLFHVAWAIDPILYYFGYPRDGMVILISAQLLIWAGFEVARKMGYSAFSSTYMRPHEKSGSLMGSLFQITSLLLAVMLFDRTTAILAMLFNCIGDSAAGLAGAALYPYIGKGRTAIRDFTAGSISLSSVPRDILYALGHRKSAALMAVMFLACAIPGFIFYPRASLLFISAGAIGAVIADGFAWKLFGYTLNDDLIITLAAGGAMAVAANI